MSILTKSKEIVAPNGQVARPKKPTPIPPGAVERVQLKTLQTGLNRLPQELQDYVERQANRIRELVKDAPFDSLVSEADRKPLCDLAFSLVGFEKAVENATPAPKPE